MQSHSNMLKMQLPLYNSKANNTDPDGGGGTLDYLNFLKPEDAQNMQSRLNRRLDNLDE